MIVGVGIDLTPIARMEELLGRWGERIERRLFTDAERVFCRARGAPAQHLAARFAAKEATLKALAVPQGLSWHEMEVVSSPGGAPRLVLSGAAAAAATRSGVSGTHLSLTHAGGLAIAVVVLERS
jgi:holo-[acyl-carrier protein] synthase